MPGKMTRLHTLDAVRTHQDPQPRLKPRGLPPALAAHGVWAAANPAEAALFGRDLLGTHRVHIAGSDAPRFTASFHGTRHIGTTSVVEIACSMPTADGKSTGPCCRSIVMLSQPQCA